MATRTSYFYKKTLLKSSSLQPMRRGSTSYETTVTTLQDNLDKGTHASVNLDRTIHLVFSVRHPLPPKSTYLLRLQILNKLRYENPEISHYVSTVLSLLEMHSGGNVRRPRCCPFSPGVLGASDLILLYYWGGLCSAAPTGSGPCSAVLRHLRAANALVRV